MSSSFGIANTSHVTVRENWGLFKNRITLQIDHEEQGVYSSVSSIRSHGYLTGRIITWLSNRGLIDAKIAKIRDSASNAEYYVNLSSLKKRWTDQGGHAYTIDSGDITIFSHPENSVQSPLSVNDAVLEGASDHSIITYIPPALSNSDRPIVYSNVMCSGDKYLANNPKGSANSFGIDPRDPNGREDRFIRMIEELVNSARDAMKQPDQTPIVALQEFPRNPLTGMEEFIQQINAAFPDYDLFFGNPEEGDEQSQLCLLIPKDLGAEPIESPDPRIQAVRVGNSVYVNIHPSPNNRKRDPNGDSFQKMLQNFCKDVMRGAPSCENIYIVGDWNRNREELKSYWPNIYSPPNGSHLPPGDPNRNMNHKPIDHTVHIERS